MPYEKTGFAGSFAAPDLPLSNVLSFTVRSTTDGAPERTWPHARILVRGRHQSVRDRCHRGACSRYHWVDLPQQYRVFDNDWIIGLALLLYVVEFVADKIPWVDSIWDAVHTVIRPIGGALIAVASVGHVSPEMEAIVALAGAGVATSSHLTKGGHARGREREPGTFFELDLELQRRRVRDRPRDPGAELPGGCGYRGADRACHHPGDGGLAGAKAAAVAVRAFGAIAVTQRSTACATLPPFETTAAPAFEVLRHRGLLRENALGPL